MYETGSFEIRNFKMSREMRLEFRHEFLCGEISVLYSVDFLSGDFLVVAVSCN